MQNSSDRPRHSLSVPAATRTARAAASLPKGRIAFVLVALLLLTLALASSAGASVYWSNSIGAGGNGIGTTIGRANDDGTGLDQAFIGGASAPGAVAVDGAHVYWSNLEDNTIGRANLDGTGVNQRFITGATNPFGVAVDGAHVYWTNVTDTPVPGAGTIGRANLDGTGIDQNFITGPDNPAGVAVDRAHVYWTNNNGHAIGRANLQGTGVNQTFIDVGFRGQPFGVAVDEGHVYWTDLPAGTLGRANLDGTGIDPSFIDAGSLPLGVAVDSAHIYWTNVLLSPEADIDDAIGRANLDGTGANPTFIIGPTSPVGVAVDPSRQTEQPASIALDDISATEGDAGQTAFRFTASLDRPESAPVTVGFTTGDATATAASDYVAKRGTVTFAPGDTAETVTVQVNGDTVVEPDETFDVNLAGATGNATIADARGVATIVNDDQAATEPPARISLADITRSEGNAAQTAFRFTASLDRPQSAAVTVDFSTGDGTATAPSDYVANRGTVTFAPRDTSEPVTVHVNGDTTKESNETFDVNLANATGNATIADDQALGTILNDDRKRRRHKFRLGKPRLNRRSGTARLAVSVPGPGRLAITGNGTTAARTMAARSVSTAGTVKLLIKASGPKQRSLNRTGTVTVHPRVTYTPTGGRPITRSTTVRLKKR